MLFTHIVRFFFFSFFFTHFVFSIPRTVIKFERAINTCDIQDRSIQNTTTTVIWSYNYKDPIAKTPVQHDVRGIKSVRFFSATGSDDLFPPPPENSSFIDLVKINSTINFTLSPNGFSTAYWNSFYRFNLSDNDDVHVIRIDPVLDPTHAAQVHHMDLYHCQTLPDDKIYWSGYEPEMEAFNAELYNCLANAPLINAWSIGGGVFLYPPNVGARFKGVNYLATQIHYNNPPATATETLIDNSGFRLWYTKELRQHDAGFTAVVFKGLGDFVIPPQTPLFPVQGYCPSQCLTDGDNFPDTGVTIFAASFHTHLTGKSGSLSRIHNGMELPIVSEPYYNFNYQDYTIFDPPIYIEKGDEFQVTCNFSTMDRINNTVFGRAVTDEMCMGLIMYYPKLELDWGCITTTTNKTYVNLTMSCGGNDVSMDDFHIPNYTRYIPPPCTYHAPPKELMTPQYFNPQEESIYLPLVPLNWEHQYQRSTWLDPDTKKYHLFWNISQETGIISALVEVETLGWIGFGLSEYGMNGGDVFIGWSQLDPNNSTQMIAYLDDRFAIMQALPPIDYLQDIYNVKIGEYDPTPPKQKAPFPLGLTVGLSVGGFVLIVIIIFLTCRLLLTTKKKKVEPTKSDPASATVVAEEEMAVWENNNSEQNKLTSKNKEESTNPDPATSAAEEAQQITTWHPDH